MLHVTSHLVMLFWKNHLYDIRHSLGSIILLGFIQLSYWESECEAPVYGDDMVGYVVSYTLPPFVFIVCLSFPFCEIFSSSFCNWKVLFIFWQNLIMQHVDHSAGDLIDLLQGLLRYDPAERFKAREALGHPFFTREPRRCGYPL